MKRRKRTRLLEFGKNVLIVFLTVSAIFLTMRGQIGTDLTGRQGGLWGAVLGLFDRGVTAIIPATSAEGQGVEIRPLRVWVNIAEVGTYGVQYDKTTVDRLFDQFFTLLGEALGSAEPPRGVTRHDWQAALTQRDSIYFDFQGEIPLSGLYAWTEAEPEGALTQVWARRLLLAEDEDGGLSVYYRDEGTETVYVCATDKLLNGHLKAAVTPYEANVNGATFAFQHKERDYQRLDPHVMLPQGGASLAWPGYKVNNPISEGVNDETRVGMIEALGFHPQAGTSYFAGGKQVVREGPDTLSVYNTGAVDYHSSSAEEPKYAVGESGIPTALEALEVTAALAEKSVGALCGDEKTVGIYLKEMTDLGEGRWQVDYGYQLNGVPVQLGTEGYAARFVVGEGRVSDFYLTARSYTVTDERRYVLPEVQASAAMGALDVAGRELLLAYEDTIKTDAVYPGWIAE